LITTCNKPTIERPDWYLDEYLAMLDSLNYDKNVSILLSSSYLPKERLTFTRLSGTGYYLPDVVQPDSVAFIGNTPIVFNFFKEATTEKRKQAKDKLYARNIINNKIAYSRKSNYPEWIHFKGEQIDTLIKGTHYRPIEELVMKLNIQ
jgi:hypothetical protein